MVIVYGTRQGGVIDRCGGTYVATQFVHVYWMPLLPLSSHLVLDETGNDDGTRRAVPVPLSGRSVLAAYLRTWGVVGALAALATGLGGLEDFADDPIAVLAPLGVAFVLLVAVGLSWALLGKLTVDDKARQLAYGTRVGYPVDPAQLGPGREGLRGALWREVVERARPYAAASYRAALDPQRDWARIAALPETTDAQLVHAALTLARVEWSYAAGAERASWQRAHDELWTKLRSLEPGLLEAVAQTAS